MAAELGRLSLNQLQNLAQSQHHSSWMWNPKAQPLEDDDSWEVRAFAEDTGNVMGTTWPPRSYTCTFCRREFRSAQALGGHMNVHRRDRARLHQTQPPAAAVGISTTTSSSTTSSSTLLFPTHEFTANAGLCLLYQLPNPNGVFTTSSPITACSVESPSSFLSISPYPSKNLMAAQSINFPATHPPGFSNSSSGCYSTKAEPSTTTFADNTGNGSSSNNCNESSIEEPDLELRLGHRPTTS